MHECTFHVHVSLSVSQHVFWCESDSDYGWIRASSKLPHAVELSEMEGLLLICVIWCSLHSRDHTLKRVWHVCLAKSQFGAYMKQSKRPVKVTARRCIWMYLHKCLFLFDSALNCGHLEISAHQQIVQLCEQWTERRTDREPRTHLATTWAACTFCRHL